MRRIVGSAPWRRAPTELLRAPLAFVLIFAGVFVLAFVVAAQPLTVAGSEAAALHSDLVNGCRYDIGLGVQAQLGVPGVPGTDGTGDVTIDDADMALRGATSGVANLEPPVVTVFSRARIDRDDGGTPERVQLIARTGATDHLGLPSGSSAGQSGVWLPDTTASSLQVGPGDLIHLTVENQPVAPLRVAGVFPDLSKARRDSYWCSMERSFEEFHLFTPDPVAVIDQSALVGLLQQADSSHADVWWEAPPAGSQWTSANATATIGSLQEVAQDARNGASALGRSIGGGASTQVDAVFTIDHATKTSRTVNGLTGATALAIALLIVVIVRQAARSWLDRSRAEYTILSLRGVSPLMLALKQLLTHALAVVAGAAAGYWIATITRGVYSPSSLRDPSAQMRALQHTAIAAFVCFVVIAVDAVAWVRAARRSPFQNVERRSSSTWLWVIAALAAAALYELESHATAISSTGRADGLALLFPMLLVAGGCGIVAHVLFRDYIGTVSLHRWPVTVRLAARRLGRAQGRTAGVAAACGLAIGAFMIAGTSYRSLTTTTEAKTTLGPGSDQIFTVLDDGSPITLDDSHASLSTEVVRTSDATIAGGGFRSVDVLAVDPTTFARAAYWDDSFSSQSLTSLLGLISAASTDGKVPAIAVGDVPDDVALNLPDAGGEPSVTTVHVVARPQAFPGYHFNTTNPLVVIDARSAAASRLSGTHEIWVGSKDPSIESDLTRDGLTILSRVAASDRLDTAALTSVLWSLDFTRLLGGVAALIAIGSMLTYFLADRRQRRVADALIQLLGRQDISVASTLIEAGCVLAVAAVTGLALASVAAFIVVPLLDPLPTAPPDLILRFDFRTAGLVILGIALATTACVAAGGTRRPASTIYEAARHDD